MLADSELSWSSSSWEYIRVRPDVEKVTSLRRTEERADWELVLVVRPADRCVCNVSNLEREEARELLQPALGVVLEFQTLA